MSGNEGRALAHQTVRTTRRSGGIFGAALEAARWAQDAARDRAAELIQDWNSRPVRRPPSPYIAPAVTTEPVPQHEDVAGRLEQKVMVLEQALDALGAELHRPVAEARAIEAAMGPLTARIRSAIERAGLDFQSTQALGRGASDAGPQPHQLPVAPVHEAALTNGAPTATDTVVPDRNVMLEDPYGLLHTVAPAPKRRRRLRREGSRS
jgi:hypothetical protein